MSDDDKNGASDANRGTTLPNGENATNNAGLSSFFLNRSGALGNGMDDLYILSRGRVGLAISSTASGSRAWLVAYRLDIGDSIITPSMRNNPISYPISLRCLVSTTNS